MLFGVAVVLVLLNIHPIHSSYVSVDHNFATDPTPTASIPIQDEWSLFQSFLENLPSNETKHQLLQSSANTHGVGQCLSDLRQIQGQVKNLSFNALRMIDAWGKLPSGILRGNLYEFGSFDECFRVRIPRQTPVDEFILPQYCLAKVLVLSGKQTILSRFSADPYAIRMDNFNILPRMGVFQPENSTLSLNIGICIPASCSPKFFETIFDSFLRGFVPKLVPSVDVSAEWCQLEKKPTNFTTLDIVMTVILIVVFNLIIVGTMYDVVCTVNKWRKREILVIFSAFTNCQKIFTFERNKSTGVIDCLHGIRAITTAWVVLGHSYYMQTALPTKNKTTILTWSTTYYSTLITAAPLVVETFFVISGFLVTLLMLKHMEKTNGRMNIIALYVHRYIRLTPMIIMVALFQSSLMKFLGDGPIWVPMVDKLRSECERDWWKLLFYVQNYFSHDTNVCLPHAWYLSIDMQLFIVAPFIVCLLYRCQWRFLVIVISAIIASISWTFYIYFYYQRDVISNYTELIYYPTHIRMFTWLIGVVLGYFVFHIRNKPIHIPKIINVIGWLASFACLASAILSMHELTQFDNRATILGEALYNVLSRLMWALGISYIVFACMHGYGGPFNWFLSLEVWLPFSRLSYAIYVVQFSIFHTIIGTMRDAQYFTDMSAVHKFLGTYVLSFLVAIFASLAFESPVLALEKIMFRSRTDSKPDEDQTRSNGTQ